MIKVTMKHSAIGNIQMEFNSFSELWEAVSIFEMPETCDKCQASVKPMFKKVMTKRQDAKVPFGTTVRTYGLRCENGHEYYLGQHNDDSKELFCYSGRKFQDPYTNEQLANAEQKEACPHCKTTNQFHAKDCPNFTENAQEPRTAIQQARDKFVRAVGELGLSLGNVELSKMLRSMLGVTEIPSPITPEHWLTCYEICNQYKTAAEIGGINLDADSLAVMLCSEEMLPGQKNIEDCSAEEWKAAAERAMEG